MPDAVQFCVTKKVDGTFKVIVQNEKEIIRTHDTYNIDTLFDILDDEVNQLCFPND